MEITLPPKVEALIRDKVSNGAYESASDLVATAVLRLDAQDRLERLRSLLREGELDFEQGNVVKWTPELHRQWRQEAEEMVRQGVAPDPDVCP